MQHWCLSKKKEVASTSSEISVVVNHINFYSLEKFSWNWGKYLECTIDRDIWSACFPNVNKLSILFGGISYILNYLITHMLPLGINNLTFHADPFPKPVPRPGSLIDCVQLWFVLIIYSLMFRCLFQHILKFPCWYSCCYFLGDSCCNFPNWLS
jgi:hypothetical protein